MEMIPAIDIIDGKCVRLAQGDFARRTVYNDDPLKMARRFEAAGLARLHLVDLDGARTGKAANLKVLDKIARGTKLAIDFGGGIKTAEDLTAVFDAGASMACVGSVAVKEPDTFAAWIDEHGPDKFLLAADVRDGKLAVNGWQADTGFEIVPFLTSGPAARIGRVLVTDIARDGLLGGPSVDLYKRILRDRPGVQLIASGGVRSVADIDELDHIGCSGVVIGKAIYEGRISLEELTAYVG